MDLIYNYLNQGLSVVIPFVILLGLLIFVHELGHFLVAKWCGVRVEVFSLGFGKKILQYKRGDTNYCLSLVPLGGYVKMFGDEVGAQISEEDRKYSFTHKSVWQRIAVVLAGPLMNFFFSIFILMLVAFMGEEVRAPRVGDVHTDTSAFSAGFRSGDLILKVNSDKIGTWDEIQEQLTRNASKDISFEVKRDGSEHPIQLHAAAQLKPNQNVLSLDDYVGDIEGLSYSSRAAVVGIVPKTLMSDIGLKTGDRIVSVNAQQISYFRDLENVFMAFQEQAVNIVVERFDGKQAQNITLNGQLGKFSSLAVLGIESSELYLSKVMEQSPAYTAGIREGDKIISIDNFKPQRWEHVLNSIKSYSGTGPIRISVARNNETHDFQVTPQMTEHMNSQGGEEKRYTIGIVPHVYSAPPVTLKMKTSNPIEALIRGVKRTNEITVMTVVSFMRLIQNKISHKNIGGVLSIGQAASETYKVGIAHFLQLMAVISVNLFILNLLPIPVLDGGHLLFYSIEALRGAPLSMRKMEIAQQVGLFILISLMVLSLFNDFSRLFGF